MTRGSHVHDELGDHVDSCKTCVLEKPVKTDKDFRGCPTGKYLYQRWKEWVRSPD